MIEYDGAPVQVYKGLRRGVQQVAVKRLTAVTDPLLLNAIRKEISILQRVSFDRNVVQVRSLPRRGMSVKITPSLGQWADILASMSIYGDTVQTPWTLKHFGGDLTCWVFCSSTARA